MSTSRRLAHVPFLLIDIVDFTSGYDSLEARRAVTVLLQRLLTDSARFFMPYGDVWQKWVRHGTGDGYYLLFDALQEDVAAEYALRLRDAVAAHNAAHGADLPLRMRLILAIGDLEWVDDQILSDPFAVANRIISHEPFKRRARSGAEPAVIAAHRLFHYELAQRLAATPFERLKSLHWTAFDVVDKHKQEHHAYVLGDGFDAAGKDGGPASPS